MLPKTYVMVFSVAVGLAGVVLLVAGGFFIDGIRRVYNQFRLARRYEKEGNWRAACYYYALVSVNSDYLCERCAARVRTLWKLHGPFDYADIQAQLLPRPKYAQGYLATVAAITKLVSSKS